MTTVIKLPRLRFNWKDQPELLERYWDEAMNSIETSLNAILSIPEIQAALITLDAATAAAQTAADNANAAAASVTDASALANSYPSGVVITATDTGSAVTIAISSHTRTYAYVPPTTVSVSSGNIASLAYSTTYFIYYDQSSRAGGTVTYVATTNQTDVAQLNNRHSVGTITTPAAAMPPTDGQSTTPPGGNYSQP